MNTLKQILVQLGYVEAGVELDKGIMNKMEEYLTSRGLRKTSYVDKEFKFIGDLYKFFFIEENSHSSIQNQSFNENNGDDYTSKFWKLYSPKELELDGVENN